MTDENRPILSVHRADFPNAEWTFFDTWDWGWVGTENGQAVAVLTATYGQRNGAGNFAGDYDEWATVQYLYSRGRKFAPEIIAHAQRELKEMNPSLVLHRSGTATPEGAAVCAHLLLDPIANYKTQRHETEMRRYRSALTLHQKQARRPGSGQAPPAPSEPKHPLQPLPRSQARADGHKILLAAAGLLGIDAIEPKAETFDDEGQATNLA